MVVYQVKRKVINSEFIHACLYGYQMAIHVSIALLRDIQDSKNSYMHAYKIFIMVVGLLHLEQCFFLK